MASLGIACALVLATALLVFTQGPNGASANGTARLVVNNARVGPYELQVGILPGTPRVGNLHLSIQVKDARDETIITDAAIKLMAAGPEGSTKAGPVRALNTPQSPQYFEADIPLDVEGSWIVTLEMDSALGQASFDLALNVQRGGGVSLIFLFVGALAFVVLLFWTWRRVRSRQRRRRQSAEWNVS